MSVLSFQLGQVVLTATPKPIGSASTNPQTVRSAVFTNTGPAAVTVADYIVPAAGTAGPANQLTPSGITIQPGGALHSYAEGQVIPAGATLSANIATGATTGVTYTATVLIQTS